MHSHLRRRQPGLPRVRVVSDMDWHQLNHWLDVVLPDDISPIDRTLVYKREGRVLLLGLACIECGRVEDTVELSASGGFEERPELEDTNAAVIGWKYAFAENIEENELTDVLKAIVARKEYLEQQR